MAQHERTTHQVIALQGNNPKELISYILHLDKEVTRWQAATLGWAVFGSTILLAHAITVWTGLRGSIATDAVFAIFTALIAWGFAK